MSFIWPFMLVALLLLPLGVLFYLLLQQRRRRFAARYGSFGFTQTTGGQPLGLRRHLPPALFLLSLTILLIALARPQTVVGLPREEGTILLTFDVSGSMGADDIKPTRIEAAKVAARDFVQRQPPGVQIGVVAFSDSGLSVQPPTDDQAAILAAINRLSPQRGTSLANGILASLQALIPPPEELPEHYTDLTPAPTDTPTPVPAGTYTSAAIVLLTDGENNESPDPLAAAQLAADRGVRIYSIGLGSPAGATLQVNGFTIHTQLNEEMLKQIAQITGGTYYNAESDQELRTVYEELSPQFVIKPENMEVTSLFAGASILILLVAGAFSLRWFSRLP